MAFQTIRRVIKKITTKITKIVPGMKGTVRGSLAAVKRLGTRRSPRGSGPAAALNTTTTTTTPPPRPSLDHDVALAALAVADPNLDLASASELADSVLDDICDFLAENSIPSEYYEDTIDGLQLPEEQHEETDTEDYSPDVSVNDFYNRIRVANRFAQLHKVAMPPSSYAPTTPPPSALTDPTGVHYAVGPYLGKGGFAICHSAERYNGSVPTGKMVALKIVKSVPDSRNMALKFVTELQIHSKLRHPNIVTFYRAFSVEEHTYVALELCQNGSLSDMLRRRKTLTLPEIRRMIIQICGGVKYLHERHIVHRDLKTGNLLLDEHMNVKISDFGLAALLVTDTDMAVQRRTTMCGTPNYIAPEVIEKGKGHDERVDLWAIGIITYTLAVGKSPFHADSKPLIYQNLRNGAYSWPNLDSTASASIELRDLVSLMLVPEEERMNTDQIVSHHFFKAFNVPSAIPASATKVAPVWEAPSLPTASELKRGYTESWFAACKSAGVGEHNKGKYFNVVTGRRVRSIVHDMAREAQCNEQPMIPLPPNKIYLSSISDWDSDVQVTPPRSRALHEIEQNAVSNPIPASVDQISATNDAQVKAARDSQLMPPPKPPTSRGIKVGKTRRVARTISEEVAKSAALGKIAEDQPLQITMPNNRDNKPHDTPAGLAALLQDYVNGSESVSSSGHDARSGPNSKRTTSSSTARTFNTATTAGTLSAPPNASIDTISGRPSRAGSTKRAADATLARRPKATTRANVRIISSDGLGPMATLDELKLAAPYKKTKINNIRPEAVEIPTDHTLGVENQSAVRHHRAAASPIVSDHVQWTRPDEVLDRLRGFRHNLEQALYKPHRVPPSTAVAPRLPFVTRWVDYSRKHGFGYVLADGTVGCVINASTKNQTPVTHVLVRNGQHHLAFLGNNFEGIEDLPLEILEDCGHRGIHRKASNSQPASSGRQPPIEASRRRTLAILWVKFGRYMCQSLDGDEIIDSANAANFVRFYQRVDTVGVWAFTDGALQIHFPDHTKLVLSPDGLHASMTMLTRKGCAYLRTNRALHPQDLAERIVITDSLAKLLDSRNDEYNDLIEPNGLRDKLIWVHLLVSQWVNNGGIGRLNNDDPANTAVLGWTGPRVRDMKKRADWVTVGRHGGD